MKNLLSVITLVGLVGCQGIKFVPTPRNELKKPNMSGISDIDPILQEDIESGMSADSFFADDSLGLSEPGSPQEIGACTYYRELGREYRDASDEQKASMKLFQLYNRLAMQTVDGKLDVKARLEMASNPQVLYATSSEANDGSKPMDMPTIDQFMELARQAYEDGELSWTKWMALKALKAAGATETLAGKRNDAVLEKVDDALSGAVTGDLKDLAKSKLFTGFLDVSRKFSKLSDMSEDDVSILGYWLVETPLTLQSKSMARDWSRTIRILNRASAMEAGAVSFSEEVCLYALTQRMSAQVLVQKGIVGAPELNDQGRLIADLPKEDIVIYPETDIDGSWGAPLTAAKIGELLAAGNGARPVNASSTVAFLNSFRTWATLLSSRRAVGAWDLNITAENKMPRLSPALLKLAVGLYALHAPVLIGDELSVSPSNRLSFPKDDSTANLLRVGHVALATVWGVEGIVDDPSALDQAVLTAEQRESLGGSGASSAKTKLRTMIDGLIFECYTRVAEGRIVGGSSDFAQTLFFLKKTAYVLRSPYMLARIKILEEQNTSEAVDETVSAARN